MTNSTSLQTISLDNLSSVTGGNGPFQRAGEQLGQKAGEAVAPHLPTPFNFAAPPVARAAGGYVGQKIDQATNWLRR